MTSGNWRLVVCGVTHKTSTLEQREILQINRDEMARANDVFADQPDVLESLVVSTCNRVEFYFVADRTSDPFAVVRSFYKQFRDLDVDPMQELFISRKGNHATDHIFRVAAGIDSMVIGENQIMSQLKEAYSFACSAKTTGKVIHRLFHQAFRVGKQVRSDTEMGKGACSVSSAAMGLLKTKIEDIKSPSVLFIGTNRMISLAARNLTGVDQARFVFANRTPEKAVALAEKYHSPGYGLDKTPELLPDVDVLITCTSADLPVVSRATIESAIEKRGDRKLIIVDLAIPRDVDYPKDASDLVDVFDLDDIKTYVRDQQERREQAIPQVEHIIERKLSEFSYWLDHVLHDQVYGGRTGIFDLIRQEELSRVMDKLPSDVRGELDDAAKRLVNRVLQVAGKQAAHQQHHSE